MDVDLVIVGAGAAGIGAAKAARWLDLDHVLVEASHRIGGRAYTEHPAPGISFDLGCHWLHSASRNPLTRLLVPYGMDVQKTWDGRSGIFRNKEWLDGNQAREFEIKARDTAAELAGRGEDIAACDAYDRDSEWAPLMDYWISLDHSTDSDQISIRDMCAYEYTGENQDWPVKQGLGTLIARFGAEVPVRLNSAVTRIDYSGGETLVHTTGGDIRASRVLLTVSTGVLNAGDVKFTPALPAWKRDAINDLPLGNHNRICLVFDRNVFGVYRRDTATFFNDDDPPMDFYIRPFGSNCAVAVTGGRFADWLERAGQQASIDYARERLVKMFGSEAGRHIENATVSAWRGDPWIRGAYSATRPGAYGARHMLAEPVDEKIYFAGEATSANFMDTAHGAYISGVREVLRLANTISHHDRNPVHSEAMAWELTRISHQAAMDAF